VSDEPPSSHAPRGEEVPVSVVVPTRDRPRLLARCLAALGAQRGIALDLVVVDDGSTDRRAVERVVAAHSARLVRLDGRGPAAARNAGIRAALGRIVLLTDDDCVPSPVWAAALAAALEGRRAVAVGRTEFDPAEPLVAASETIVAHAERRGGFAATRNLALPRDLALDVPLDERFVEAGGEDREWGRRLARHGATFVRVDDARVRHAPELDLRGFWRQHVRYGRAARTDSGLRAPGPRAALDLVAAGFSRGARVGALVLLAQAATLLGYVSRRPL
jgi:glycosyltransferase involved in cell wall biosynthesis